MINTVNTKKEQLEKGFYSIGSGSETILIIGSCRSVPYMNYLNDWNKNVNRFTICFIDPYNWNYDLNDNRISLEDKINSLETHEGLLNLFKNIKYFIHEHYANFGMFNVDKNSPKNIFQFGMNPEFNISIPAFNDCFILTNDIVSFDTAIRKKAIADYNVIGRLSKETLADIEFVRNNNLQKFYNNCLKTDFPEFADIFEHNYKIKRYFWNSNHVAKSFTKILFEYMDRRFLHINCGFDNISNHDMYANNYTYLSEYDEGYLWNEEIKPLKNIL